MNKITILTFGFFSFSLSAMENAQHQLSNSQLQQWVGAARHIKVQSLKLSSNIPIDHNTTILDVKNALFDQEGIPADQQTLMAITKNPWTLWLTKTVSEHLADESNIKEIMNDYDTDTLQLYLRLRTRPANG